MTDQTPEDGIQPIVRLNVYTGKTKVIARTVLLGSAPLIIIEPHVEDGGELIVKVAASALEDHKDVAELLAYVAEVLADGTIVDD